MCRVRGWRWAVRGLLGGTGLAIVGYVIAPGPVNSLITDGILYVNPTGIDGAGLVSSSLIAFGTIVALISALSTVVAIRQRYRRSAGTLREQMRLLVLVAAIAGSCMLLGFIGTFVGALLGNDAETPAFFLALFVLLVVTLLVGVPGAYLIAIFRHGLWDMGLVIRKTVQYGVLVVAFMLLGFVIVGAGPDPADRRRWHRLRADGPHRGVPRRGLPLAATARYPVRQPAGLRTARHPVRGALGVQRTGRGDLLHRRRAAADGPSARAGHRRQASRRVAARGHRAALRGEVADRRRTPADADSSARRGQLRDRPTTTSPRSGTRTNCWGRSRSTFRRTTR